MDQDGAQKLKLEPRAWDKTFQLISWWDVEKVRSSRIMVVGAGALGNEVLKNLALLNVGEILIVDFDTIEYSNLSRSVLYREADCSGEQFKCEVAADRIREINPNLKVMTLKGDIILDVGLGVFRRMDAVIGCLDNRLARLFINRHCHKVNKIWIDGAIENLAGQLNVYKPGKACYECELTDTDWINIRQKLGCPDIAKRNAAQGKVPTTPISASIIGAMQVQEALKIIHNNVKQSLAGTKFYYEGMTNLILQYESPALNDECLSHYEYENVIEDTDLSSEMTVKELMAKLQQKFGEDVSVELDNEVILEVTSKSDEKVFELVVAKPHMSDTLLQQFTDDADVEVVITKEAAYIDNSFPKPDIPLKSIGIPPLHIITVQHGDQTSFVELTGDQKFLHFK